MFLPNYVRVSFAPFKNMYVEAEYWVPDSHTLAGRFMLQNLDTEARSTGLRVHALLRPGDNPQVMDERLTSGVSVLAGSSSDLRPVLFLGGGAQVEQIVYPALAVRQELQPGERKVWLWAQAARKDEQESFDAARKAASVDWDGEIAKLELLAASQLEIETGDQDWDTAFAFSQKVALASFMGPTEHLPHAGIVHTRHPDCGYSARGDGKDYGPHWEGYTAASLSYVVPQIVHAAPGLAKGALLNFVETRLPGGELDWKPGLGGQRSGQLSVPLGRVPSAPHRLLGLQNSHRRDSSALAIPTALER
jgi:hypothetical protein